MNIKRFWEKSSPKKREETIEWEFSITPEITPEQLEDFNQQQVVLSCRSDSRNSEGYIEDQGNGNITSVINNQIFSDFTRTKDVKINNVHYFLSNAEITEEMIEEFSKKYPNEKIKCISFANDSNGEQKKFFIQEIRRHINEISNSDPELADYLMANMHQGGFLNIGRVHLANYHPGTQLKVSDPSFELKRNEAGDLVVIENFKVMDYLQPNKHDGDLVSIKNTSQQNKENANPQQDDNPLAQARTESIISKDKDGKYNFNVVKFELKGTTSPENFHTFEEMMEPKTDQKSHLSKK